MFKLLAIELEHYVALHIHVCNREGSTTLPFTPFSVLLGNMVKDIHTVLLNTLSREGSPLTVTQTIKVK